MAKYITDIRASLRRRAAFVALLVTGAISMHMVALAQDNATLKKVALAVSVAALYFLFDTISRWACAPAHKAAPSKADNATEQTAAAALLASESILDPPLADEDEALACLGHSDADEPESLLWEAMSDDDSSDRWWRYHMGPASVLGPEYATEMP